MSTDFTVVGKPLKRVDGVARATGRIAYGVDVKLAGMLHGKILRSEYPHARIRRIDYGPALRLPGVKAVVTGADDPGGRFGSRMADQAMMAHLRSWRLSMTASRSLTLASREKSLTWRSDRPMPRPS